jgi:hypothetical protein
MLACPRSARTPPPGRPTLPSSSWMIDPALMNCAPRVCCVQPTLYTRAVVRSLPEFSVHARHTSRNNPGGTPQIRSTISGV